VNPESTLASSFRSVRKARANPESWVNPNPNPAWVRFCLGDEVLRVEGAGINLGGLVVDKLGMKDASGTKFCSLERRLVAATTCYDVYDAKGEECIAKIEREFLSATPKYKFFYEGDSNPFPDFYAEGSFSQRRYTFTNGMGETIARVSREDEMVKDVDQYLCEVRQRIDRDRNIDRSFFKYRYIFVWASVCVCRARG